MSRSVQNFTRQRLTLLLLLLSAGSALAQWRTQTIPLRAGWNAVFLEVQPEPRECNTIFAAYPAIESVWGWNRRFSSVQFIDDARNLVPGQPDWLTWVAPGHPFAAENSLNILEGGKPYLIKVASNSPPFNLSLYGVPRVRSIDWLSDSLNFVGFHLDPTSLPTFRDFFHASSAHTNQPVYRLTASGLWTNVPSSSRMTNGQSFWIKTEGQSAFAGPLETTFEQGRGMDYGRILQEQTLRLKNNSTNSRTFVLTQLASGTPPAFNEYPSLAGPVPLSYWRMNLGISNGVGWFPYTTPISNVLAPGAEWSVRLAVRRPDMNSFTPSGSRDYLYQSLVTVNDGAGELQYIPVTSRGMQRVTVGGSGAQMLFGEGGSSGDNPRAGLWVGSATINQVSEPSAANPDTPQPTKSEFQFRLIVHVDTSGVARLLQKVLLLWQNGTYTNTDVGFYAVNQPGRYVLLTRDDLIPGFSGAAMRDGESVGRRISTTAFSFRDPKLLSGGTDFGQTNNPLSVTVSLDFDDPVNPYKHKYHPDHDNQNALYNATVPVGRESFTIVRKINMTFTATDPENLKLAGWGDNQLGGIYNEAISGLHRRTNYISGTFRLQKVSRVGVLNDGLQILNP